jgi:hypothetical protein
MIPKNIKFVELANENCENQKVGIHPWKIKIYTMHCSKSFQDLIAYSFHILGV